MVEDEEERRGRRKNIHSTTPRRCLQKRWSVSLLLRLNPVCLTHDREFYKWCNAGRSQGVMGMCSKVKKQKVLEMHSTHLVFKERRALRGKHTHTSVTQ